jgi:anti-sigma regulatory factor (Ser/Thr protein kinase)
VYKSQLLSLWDIAFGNLHWVGLHPRTHEEALALPDDWKMLYISSVNGLFELAEVDRHEIGDFSPDQQYSSEAFYAATHSGRVNAAIIARSIFPHRRKRSACEAPTILSLITGDGMLEQLHRFLSEQLAGQKRPIPPKRVHEIITAVHEAVANILKHAYKDDEGRPIQLQFLASDGQVYIDLYDLGVRFDPARIPLPDFETEGGYGWYLINQIAESAVYSHIDSGWNRLSMIFSPT